MDIMKSVLVTVRGVRAIGVVFNICFTKNKFVSLILVLACPTMRSATLYTNYWAEYEIVQFQRRRWAEVI